MAERKQRSFDGQNSDGGSKDSLESQTVGQRDPYRAKASEFPVKKVVAGHGQSSDASGEHDALATLSKNQESPREVEIPGAGAKDSMSSRASSVAANFKVGKNGGESGVAPVSPKNEYSVDLVTGRIGCSKYTATRVGEVEEDSVSIG